MSEPYSRQSLPSKKYRELLGSAICVFNSNNSFIIENFLKKQTTKYTWYELIDKPSGQLLKTVREQLSESAGTDITELFDALIGKRNRIIHSFRITNQDGEQSLATKTRENIQFEITEEYLLEFIEENGLLSTKLHEFRGY